MQNVKLNEVRFTYNENVLRTREDGLYLHEIYMQQ